MVLGRFQMNGYFWTVVTVPPRSLELVDRTGRLCVATTDANTMMVYLSDDISGSFRDTVMLHELGHCAMFSYGLLDQIHRMVYPEYWEEAEEWICNFFADYGLKMLTVATDVLPDEAWLFIPDAFEKLMNHR